MTKGCTSSAIAAGEFCVYYQPRFSVKRRAPCAAEALLRWPARPGVSPDVFVPQLERNGQIEPVTMFVAESVCQHIRSLRASLGVSPKIAINVPPALLSDKRFVARIRALLRSYDVAPELIEIEITESTIAPDISELVTSAEMLRADGCGIALDDFGTGFSGLRYLDLIPASIIKMDRHFVSGLGERKTCDLIVASVARMARDTGMIAVAEGVETQAQYDHVTGLGYHDVQGFLLGRPMPFDQFVSFLADHRVQRRASGMTQPRILLPAGC